VQLGGNFLPRSQPTTRTAKGSRGSRRRANRPERINAAAIFGIGPMTQWNPPSGLIEIDLGRAFTGYLPKKPDRTWNINSLNLFPVSRAASIFHFASLSLSACLLVRLPIRLSLLLFREEHLSAVFLLSADRFSRHPIFRSSCSRCKSSEEHSSRMVSVIWPERKSLARRPVMI